MCAKRRRITHTVSYSSKISERLLSLIFEGFRGRVLGGCVCFAYLAVSSVRAVRRAPRQRHVAGLAVCGQSAARHLHLQGRPRGSRVSL